MAIQTSLRVRKIFANKFAGLSTAYSKCAMIFVSDAVAVPTSAEGMKTYLHAVLNYSPNYGGGSGNRDNLLAWTVVMPGATTELSQVSNLAIMTSNRAITPVKTGKVGSILVIAPHYYASATPTNGSNIAIGTATSISSLCLPTNSSIANAALGIPEALSVSSGSGYAVNNYFNGVHFITDSVGDQLSSACVKVSSLDLIAGTPFTLYGFSVRANIVS